MNLLMTMDIGTTGVKICVLDERFKISAKVGSEYILETAASRVELNPQIYLDAIFEGIQKLSNYISLQDVIGISITTQGETIIPVAEDGTLLYNAVVWLDGRANEEASYINEKVDGAFFYDKTGIPECNALCPVCKLLWFKNNEKAVYEKTKYFLLLEDFIIWTLTGRFVTEKSLLSTTGYFDIIKDELWQEIFAILDLDMQKIPTAMDCGEVVGTITSEIAKQTGLSENVKVVTGAMDQVCGAIGAGNYDSDLITETTGTALCIGATKKMGSVDQSYFIPVYRHYSHQLQLLLPVSMTAGMALKWFKDVFCQEEEIQAREKGQSVYDYLGELAKTSPPLAHGLQVLPYFSGSIQPIYAPEGKASFCGVGLHTTKADFIRAIMEGVGYMLRENVALLEEITGKKAEYVMAMGGGANSALWNQVKADILGISIVVPHEKETASQGAAMLCAVGLKLYASIEDAYQALKLDKTEYDPNKELIEAYQQGFETYSKRSEVNL